MSAGGSGLGDKLGEVVSRAKSAVGAGDDDAGADNSLTGQVRSLLHAFGEGDMDAFFDAFDEEAEWEAPKGANFPAAGEQHGRDAIRERLVADVKRTYASFGFRPDHFLEAEKEDVVAVLGTFVGDPIEARTLDTPGVQVWTFDGKKVSRVRIYADSSVFPKPREEQAEDEDKGAKDKGAKDKGAKDKASDDKASDDKGSEAEASDDKGSEAEASDDKGSEDEHRGEAERRDEPEAQSSEQASQGDGEGREGEREREGEGEHEPQAAAERDEARGGS